MIYVERCHLHCISFIYLAEIPESGVLGCGFLSSANIGRVLRFSLFTCRLQDNLKLSTMRFNNLLRSDSSHSLSDEESPSRLQRERKMQRRQSQVAEKLAQKVASMRSGDNGNEVIPKIPEFE